MSDQLSPMRGVFLLRMELEHTLEDVRSDLDKCSQVNPLRDGEAHSLRIAEEALVRSLDWLDSDQASQLGNPTP